MSLLENSMELERAKSTALLVLLCLVLSQTEEPAYRVIGSWGLR